jgi:hypothetical protein
MGYSKFYYALLHFKNVLIFTCFNVTIYIEFELFVYLVNYIFLIKIFCFLGKLAYVLIIYNRKLLLCLALQMFGAINDCDSDSKKWFFFKMNGYQKNV